MAGAFVPGPTSFFMMPGNRKSIGETVCDALMPPQPPVKSASATNIANGTKFQFNLTCTL
jgi:hypothetical protein